MHTASVLRLLGRVGSDPGRAASWVVKMSGRGAAIAAYAAQLRPSAWRGLAGRVRLALDLVQDVRAGRYASIPWTTAGSLAVALAYFLVPLDAVPDLLPLTGFVDDAAVLGLVFAAAERDLRQYCAWRGLDPAQYFTVS
jgi:uncharacterized membrane protein YkvA (DUF1232 family)